MRRDARIAVVIPARNEAASIGNVLDAIPDWIDDVVVADNGSTDGTARVAKAHGARVVREPRRGYGSACLRGIAALRRPDIVVFLDADYSDYPEEMVRVVDPILDGGVDMVVGSRVLGDAAPGALTPQARFGNRLACFLMRLIWGARYTDLGPFRAIRYATLMKLDMRDPDYGWTVEMQIKAAVHRVRVQEVPVSYRKRIGRSKVSGTVRGVVGAGYKILGHIVVGALRQWTGTARQPQPADAIIVFTRYPEAGKTKTRMIPELGEEGAAELQRAMTEHVANNVAAVPGRVERSVRFAGGDEGQMHAWLGRGFLYEPQGPGDLGVRMGRAFTETFARPGIAHAVIVGSDCPEVTPGILRAAFTELKNNDLVLGPATDGGYYLIGLRRDALVKAVPQVFDGIAWGTATVLDATLERAAQGGLCPALLAPLEDVDRPEDLDIWKRSRPEPEDSRPFVSVIIPAWNESARIGPVIERAAKDGAEVLVIDGQSDDETQAIAGEKGAVVHTSDRGRARQMNLGSAKAAGEVLMFLHADTLLPEDYVDRVRAVINDGGKAGAFRFATDDDRLAMRFMAWGVNLRSRYLGMPYGDQALFVERELFRELGGFRHLPIMEDFDLVRRLNRVTRLRLVEADAVTSARRWRRLGPWRTMVRNQCIVLAWYLGVSPTRLAEYYKRPPGRNA